VDQTENLISYLYPTDSSLVQNSWTEYWNRKQEQEPGSLSLINEVNSVAFWVITNINTIKN